jgi:hypothetical protein
MIALYVVNVIPDLEREANELYSADQREQAGDNNEIAMNAQ